MGQPINKILIIQTAFIGDVILATPVIEVLKQNWPTAQIDFLLRKGNESLLQHYPGITNLLVWDKQKGKYRNLWQHLHTVRRQKYDYVINLQRFASTGLFTALSGGRVKIGFKNNPFSWCFTHRVQHIWGNSTHETTRNLSLLHPILGTVKAPMALFPSEADFDKVAPLKTGLYICIAPTSVWFTKQFPITKWIEFISQVTPAFHIYLLGAKSDTSVCDDIIAASGHPNVKNLCGQLNLLQSAALMHHAAMNYVNDSAPLHLCSAMNAPTTAVFCSTVPEFGFGPLSDNAVVVQINQKLPCRPCGMHGYRQCPLKHYKCGYEIGVEQLLNRLPVI